MKTVNELRQERAPLVTAMGAIHRLASEGRRELTIDEQEKWNGMEIEVRRLDGEIARQDVQLQREADLAKKIDGHSRAGNDGGEYEVADRSNLISREQSFENNLRSRGLIEERAEYKELTLGGAMRSLVTGPRTDAERRALAEGADSTGGISVPDITLARFVDKLRAATVVVQAGAQTLPLTSDKATIARTITDPTCAWRAENAAIAESDPAFEGLVFVPRSLAVHFKISRELLEDSVNIEQALEASLTGALSVELDRVALEGTGTPPQPLGISGTTNVGAVAVTAAITSWDKFIDGLYELWVDNAGDPTGIVMHPRTLKTIAGFKEATTNAPLAPPPVLAKVPLFRTTGIAINLSPGTATTAYIGDFRELILGIRTGLRIEVLRELFAVNHQYGFVAHMRADIGLQHAQSFCKLTGIVP